MAYRINNLNTYDLVTLDNGIELKSPTGSCHRGSDTELFLYLFPENQSLDTFDKIFQNPDNLQEIRITDSNKQQIYDTLRGFKYLVSIGREYQGAYHDGYDDNGEYYKITSDLVKILLRRESPEDAIPKMQATMEYMAIMSDIDIDEEI